jgi:competence protein ComEC
LQSDILKVAHHGSRTSTSAAWLKIVRPRIALISAGPQNSFGHPHLEVLERLASARCRVLRTDLSGVIELRWRRGGPISVELPRSPRRMMGRLP